jgi:tetratricopeptide (TPR) repeat protein
MFEASLKINPENVHVYNRLGIAYRKQGKCSEAIAAYQKAIVIDPEDENLHYNLGRAFLEGGMKDAAVPCFEKALELYPEFREARQILEIIFDSDS